MLGARAALLALIVQFTIAFGHVHVASAGSAVPAGIAAFNFADEDLSAPIRPDHEKNSDDAFCAICATVNLTGSAQAATAPALPLPVTYTSIEQLLASEAVRDDLRCLDLRSRGPPQA